MLRKHTHVVHEYSFMTEDQNFRQTVLTDSFLLSGDISYPYSTFRSKDFYADEWSRGFS